MQQWDGLVFLLASPRFEEENQRLLELNQRCQFASSATMQWLDIRLQLMGAAVVSAIAGIALVQHQQGLANPGTTPGPLTLTSEVCDSHPLPKTSPCTVPQTFHLPPRFPMRMCCNSPAPHPHFRVEETESQGLTCPRVGGSETRMSLQILPLACSAPSPALFQVHLSSLTASPGPLHCFTS